MVVVHVSPEMATGDYHVIYLRQQRLSAAVSALMAFVMAVGNEAMNRVGNLEMKRHNGNRYTIRVRTGRLFF